MFGEEPKTSLGPADVARIKNALEGACKEATLTGAAGRKIVYRSLLAAFRQGASDDELKRQAVTIIAQRRGLARESDLPAPH